MPWNSSWCQSLPKHIWTKQVRTMTLSRAWKWHHGWIDGNQSCGTLWHRHNFWCACWCWGLPRHTQLKWGTLLGTLGLRLSMTRRRNCNSQLPWWTMQSLGKHKTVKRRCNGSHNRGLWDQPNGTLWCKHWLQLICWGHWSRRLSPGPQGQDQVYTWLSTNGNLENRALQLLVSKKSVQFQEWVFFFPLHFLRFLFIQWTIKDMHKIWNIKI